MGRGSFISRDFLGLKRVPPAGALVQSTPTLKGVLGSRIEEIRSSLDIRQIFGCPLLQDRLKEGSVRPFEALAR